jgi:hypothetical protein
MHGIDAAQQFVMWIGIADELRRQRIEERRGRRSLGVLVNGRLLRVGIEFFGL